MSRDLCHACSATRPAFNALRSWGAYSGPLQNAIRRLKYRRDIAMGEALSRPMVACLGEQGWQVDLVVPVPLGVARQAERGYNQAALLAKPIALACHLEYNPRAVKRIRETRSQVGLTHDERWENVKASFAALPKFVDGKRVLIVDDVATSGATLNACDAALRAAGAVDAYALTLARA